ncbi:MAG: tRNA (adenosine(37)-N6)-threonylcarbamoyltransferase complex transferase subunit TsaD [Caldimicrobium sp.]|nr:tRNA (adenosine(37)-N6)-threonylcarbamoyltransferase complex transferase subunit TsaD [Caldimicrobium sp.]MCX7613099.1 tRNA (adenosine(37)-N6)-threonylcarbamoyltransferase complex transferase subunit TsaD [Caldimicrobium sp.]MDW8183054.1 tRNA (adenosine(37)-N6)-threonylcarbamoyltransferase complex transferase subunit TsaD [Caldimicrobium sp.]
MLLAIETSCDETGVAIFSSEGKLLKDYLYSQVALHSPFGGIVPEIASRKQLEVLYPLVKMALGEVGIKPTDLKAIAATFGPGLLGSLLVGVTFTKTLALTLNVPLFAIDHLEAHIFSVLFERDIPFPFLGLLVSGGHTALFLVRGYDSLELLGHTRDDAAGEAFDKAAKLLGLPYPGGPVISKLAEKGDPHRYHLPRPMLDEGNYDFSFSGLKTALYQLVRGERDLAREDLCASFEHAICEVLVEKTLRASRDFGVPRIVVAGGVSANQHLRKLFMERAHGEEVFFPSLHLCTDNAVMVGYLGWIKWMSGESGDLIREPYTRAVYKRKD